MTGRSLYLVAYDVRNPKRLRLVHKKMCGYGDPLQYSVFQCELSEAERHLMIADLSEIIHHSEDRILVVNLGHRKRRAKHSVRILGSQDLPDERGPVVF
jgi:CRISPR-associated protein Cas2